MYLWRTRYWIILLHCQVYIMQIASQLVSIAVSVATPSSSSSYLRFCNVSCVVVTSWKCNRQTDRQTICSKALKALFILKTVTYLNAIPLLKWLRLNWQLSIVEQFISTQQINTFIPSIFIVRQMCNLITLIL
jgi:hypothetical protein